MNYNEGMISSERISSFMLGVYALMAAGLALTGLVSYYISTQPSIYVPIFSKPLLTAAIVIAQLLLVVVMSFWIMRMSYPMALLLFFLFAASMGITMSSIFLVYTQASIFQTFVVVSGMFAVMAFWGYITKTDLSTVGNIGFMALIGLIIAMLVNYFLQSQVIDYILSGAGVLIFSLLTAYDTQKLKLIAREMTARGKTIAQVSIFGALTLYLDFINLFLFMLRFMGTPRKE